MRYYEHLFQSYLNCRNRLHTNIVPFFFHKTQAQASTGLGTHEVSMKGPTLWLRYLPCKVKEEMLTSQRAAQDWYQTISPSCSNKSSTLFLTCHARVTYSPGLATWRCPQRSQPQLPCQSIHGPRQMELFQWPTPPDPSFYPQTQLTDPACVQVSSALIYSLLSPCLSDYNHT